MFQQGKGKLEVCWTSIQKNESFVPYYMRILNSCV